jgi:hypothetical protein
VLRHRRRSTHPLLFGLMWNMILKIIPEVLLSR